MWAGSGWEWSYGETRCWMSVMYVGGEWVGVAIWGDKMLDVGDVCM